MAQKPSIPKGTRDFSPSEIARREYITGTIKKQFELFGFQPIETPSFENSETLMGKYGEEGDRLIFKILNSGEYLKKVPESQLEAKDYALLTKAISEKALRYDLTVPFARYVVMHQNEIDFPFKRYQIQPVWRADRPQKGRFREFYQCDADVVGPTSLIQEVEFILLYDSVFRELNLPGVTIQLNHRKLLSGIAEVIGAADQLTDFTTALDKLDKIGEEGVKNEMLNKGISAAAVEKAGILFKMEGKADSDLEALRTFLKSSTAGLEAIEELEFVLQEVNGIGLSHCRLALNASLARGLNYYTGTIMEVSAPDGVNMGSIGGGGRYDDLTGIFGLRDLSGIGISFGLDRIYLVLEELERFPQNLDRSLDVLFINFGTQEAKAALKLVQQLRGKGIKADLYPASTKLQKQMKFANNKGVPYVVLLGESEMENGEFVVKQMASGAQQTYKFEELDRFATSL